MRFQFRIWIILCLVLFPALVNAQWEQAGEYPVFNFSPKAYNALQQNWCILEDHRGIMYFGNNQGVLEYDGADWNIIKPRYDDRIRSIDIDREGRIYIGSVNDFGYLVPDSIGQMGYASLADELDSLQGDFGDVWKTFVSKRGIIFQTQHYLFIYQDGSIITIPSEQEIHESFYTSGDLYLNFSESGLHRLVGDKFIALPEGGIFSEKYIYGMLELSPGRVIIATETDGFYLLESKGSFTDRGRISKIKTSEDELFAAAEIYNIIRLDSSRISIGTWGLGAIIIDTSFQILSIIDKGTGLQDEIVQGQYADPSGNLWLALSNGISRVETGAALTRFSDYRGLTGSVKSITRFDNTLYAATNTGLYNIDKKHYNKDLTDFARSYFTPVDRIDFECWDMITYRHNDEEILLVITNDYIMEVGKNNKTQFLFNEYANTIHQSKLDPNRVFVGLESGLMSIYRKAGKWINEGYIEGIDEWIDNLSEDHMGNLWAGTQDEGILRLHIQNFKADGLLGEYSVSRFGEEQGLPKGPFIISQFRGPVTVATNTGLYKYIMQEERFEPDSSYGTEFADGTYYIHRITEYSKPEIWMVTYNEQAEYKFGVGYLHEREPYTYDWVNEPFKLLGEEATHAIFQDDDGIVWFGGAAGVSRFDPNVQKDYQREYKAYIRRIEFSEGGNVFGGTYFDQENIPSLEQVFALKPILPYSKNSMVFHYAAQPGEDESFMRYSYFLEGNDKDWSEWTPETKKEYTNLHERKYLFRVKARNIYDQESIEANYEFTILAPWYRKWWAYMLYVLIASAIVYIIVKVYTRQLREIIRERTAEVVEQKEVIEEKNKDIMDSIQYAKKIQRALLPPEDDMGKLDLDGFILFLPRDVVSGDFYWLHRRDGKIITVAADSTGHGVPGAFMSMLGVAFLNNIVSEGSTLNAGEILDELRAEVIAALKQKGHEGEQKDGMDLALHIIDQENMKIEFAGANNSLIIIRDNELIQFKADRMPIGIHERADQPFTNHEIDAVSGDVLYTFSDGFQDQFGGEKNKKYMIKRLKELFLKIHQEPMEKQKEILLKEFNDWIVPYDTEQVDDVIIIGVRI